MLKRLAMVLAALGFVLSAGMASAASSCKGLSNSKCEGANACYWVKSYKTKKGASVKAHCRAKPNGGASASSTKKKKTKKKSVASSSTASSTSNSTPESDTKKKKKKKKAKKKKKK